MNEPRNIHDLRSRICVSIAEASTQACLEMLAGVPFAEVRLDAIENLSEQEVQTIFTSPARLVATCRSGGAHDERRFLLLAAAVQAGAAYVDVELEAGAGERTLLVQAARQAGCTVIVSHHDHERTPGRQELVAVVEACFNAGAHVAKVACRTHNTRDTARLLGLLDDSRDLVVIGMGAEGTITRVAGPLMGAVFTYASPRREAQTAPGQLTAAELEHRMRAWL